MSWSAASAKAGLESLDMKYAPFLWNKWDKILPDTLSNTLALFHFEEINLFTYLLTYLEFRLTDASPRNSFFFLFGDNIDRNEGIDLTVNINITPNNM